MIHHVLFQIVKPKLDKILQSKKETFCIKASICKFEDKTKYALSDYYIKTDQSSDPVIINTK